MKRIKALDAQYAEQISNLIKESFMAYEIRDYPSTDQQNIRAFLDNTSYGAMLKTFNNVNIFWGCVEGDKLLGVVCIDTARDNIQALFVSPSMQGKGIESKLLNKVYAYCQKNNKPVLKAMASPHNLPLFQEFGFEVLGGVEFTNIGYMYIPVNIKI